MSEKQELAVLKLNILEKLIKSNFLRKLRKGPSSANRYNNLSQKLKYDTEIVDAVMESNPNQMITKIPKTFLPKYLTHELAKNANLDEWALKRMIIDSKGFDFFVTPQKLKAFNILGIDAEEVIEKTGNIEKYLTIDMVRELKISSYSVIDLIRKSGNIQHFLTPDFIEATKMTSANVIEIIKTTGDIEKYLSSEMVKAGGLMEHQVVELILSTRKINSKDGSQS